jgi:hypothetical protein
MSGDGKIGGHRKNAGCNVSPVIGKGILLPEALVTVLATELSSPARLMDDSDGVRVATAGGANVIRTPGSYRFIRQSVPSLMAFEEGFLLRQDHYRIILPRVGE